MVGVIYEAKISSTCTVCHSATFDRRRGGVDEEPATVRGAYEPSAGKQLDVMLLVFVPLALDFSTCIF